MLDAHKGAPNGGICTCGEGGVPGFTESDFFLSPLDHGLNMDKLVLRRPKIKRRFNGNNVSLVKHTSIVKMVTARIEMIDL